MVFFHCILSRNMRSNCKGPKKWNRTHLINMERDNQRYVIAAAGAGLMLGAYAWIRNQPGYSFRNRVVLVVGGSRGLGLAIARELDEQGAKLALCARDAAELDRARQQLESSDVLTIPCDITNREQVDELVRRIIDHFGHIDVLINCAGIIAVGPLESMTIEDFHQAMDVNYWGPLHTCLAVIPHMKHRHEGRIVNVSSIGGKISVPHLVPYSASKFALVGLSHGLRAELEKDGIVVTTICPGLMRTGSPRNATFKGQNEDEYAWFSVSDSSRLTSIDADRAARQILDACRRGDAEVILTPQAKLAAKMDAIFPEWSSALMEIATHLLPKPGGIGKQGVPGHQSGSEVTRSPLTELAREAEVRNNQL